MIPSLKKITSLFALGLAVAAANQAHAVSFTYTSEPLSSIAFNGSSQFTFSGPTNNFRVTSGTATGLLGEITGLYTIGAITTSGTTSSAPVSGTGTFVIHDGSFDLSGSLSWIDISQTGTGDTLNTVGSINLTGVTYSGVNADLLTLKNDTAAYNVLTFQFVPAVSLASLTTSSNSTSFSGSITSVPDGGTSLILLGLALSSLAIVRRKILA